MDTKQTGATFLPDQWAFVAKAAEAAKEPASAFLRDSTKTLAADVLQIRLPEVERLATGPRAIDPGQGWKDHNSGSYRIPCHLTETEKHLCTAAAGRRGLTLPMFVRMAALIRSERVLGVAFVPGPPGNQPDMPKHQTALQLPAAPAPAQLAEGSAPAQLVEAPAAGDTIEVRTAPRRRRGA